jgi:hypothetical protein
VTRVTLCSAKGSPGVTTLSCVLGAVWPTGRNVVVAECDPSGGDVAGRFQLSVQLGMTSLILIERQRAMQPVDHMAHTQQLPGGLDVLVGPAGADSATSLDHELGLSSSDLVADDCDLLVDCGRLLPSAVGQEKMMRGADEVLLLVRPDLVGIAHARWAASKIKELSPTAASVLIFGTGLFKPAEVAAELDMNVLGVVPIDHRAADMACGKPGSGKEFSRSPLVRFAREVVGGLLERVSVETVPDVAIDGAPDMTADDDRRGLTGRLRSASPATRASRPEQDEQARVHSS